MRAILAGLDLTQYESIARNPIGYPFDKKILASECTRAKNLFRRLVDTAKADPRLRSVAYDCEAQQTLDVSDYKWVSEILQVCIRVTIDKSVDAANSDSVPEHVDVIYVPSKPLDRLTARRSECRATA